MTHLNDLLCLQFDSANNNQCTNIQGLFAQMIDDIIKAGQGFNGGLGRHDDLFVLEGNSFWVDIVQFKRRLRGYLR